MNGQTLFKIRWNLVTLHMMRRKDFPRIFYKNLWPKKGNNYFIFFGLNDCLLPERIKTTPEIADRFYDRVGCFKNDEK